MSDDFLRSQAVALAKQGRRVFPLIPNGKKPAEEGWQSQASTDPELVYKLWSRPGTGEPRQNNIGIATGQGLLVLDVDNKNGIRGAASLEGLELLNDNLPVSFKVSTPNGGHHIYLSVPQEGYFRSNASVIGRGLDIRGDGGFAVAPGSIIDGKRYEVVVEADDAKAPDWFLPMVSGTRPVKADSVAALEGVDHDNAAARAVTWLQNYADRAVEGDGGDVTTYEVACRVLDFGVCPSTAIDLMLEHWNPHCSPPWESEGIEQKVANAARYRHTAIGSSSADVEFDVVELPEVAGDETGHEDMPVTSGSNPFPIEFANAVADTATNQNAAPLVEGLLDQGAMSMLYAPSNEGKTFVALSLAASVAKGALWAGRETWGGLVVYFATEGGRGIRKRFAAYRQIHGLPAPTPLALIASAADFLHSGVDCSRLIASVREAERQAGRSCVLIVIDTLSRVLAGGDENSSTDMGAIIQRLDSLRSATGSHVMLVHHTGKDASRGARGWSGLRAAVDTELEVKDQAVHVTKQRDLEFARAIPFTLEGVVIGADDRGRDITSAVARVGVSSVDEFGAELVDDEAEAMAAFRDAATEKFGERYRLADDRFFLKTKEWQAKIDGNRSVKGQDLTVARTTWNDRRRVLMDKGAVKNLKQGQWVALK